MGRIIPYMMGKNVPNHQPYIYIILSKNIALWVEEYLYLHCMGKPSLLDMMEI
jgi:hypothetical protein